MKKIIFLFGFFILILNNQAQTVTDIDGNVYNTVIIGTQEWMQENLKVKHYRNGDAIPNITDNAQWIQTTGAYCYYINSASYGNTYGLLYNWYAVVDTRELCPTGWHTPTDAEWTTLTNYLGGESVAGGKLKEAGTSHWNSPNTGATNSSGFTALPGGRRYPDGSFVHMGWRGYWWTATEDGSSSFAWNRILDSDYAGIYRDYDPKPEGRSLRCMKDDPTLNQSLNIKKSLIIYPNPAKNKINIELLQKSDVSLQIYDIAGNIVLKKELLDNKNEINISFLKQGTYIIKIAPMNYVKLLIKD